MLTKPKTTDTSHAFEFYYFESEQVILIYHVQAIDEPMLMIMNHTWT